MKNKKVLIPVFIIAGSLLTALLAVFVFFAVFLTRVRNVLPFSVLSSAKRTGKTIVATVTPDRLSAQKLKKVGKHILYEEDFFERCYLDKEEKNAVLDVLPKVDRQLTDDVCLTMMNRSDGTLGYDYRFGFYQMLNGAVIDDTFEEVIVNDGRITVTASSSKPFISGIQPPESQNIASVDDIYDIVLEHCNAHKREMTLSESEPLKGTYVLKYGLIAPTQSFDYYYFFTVNEYSHLKVSPYTGEIYEEYYWNGVYID
ncbi:MAG: hypothetical protein IKP92_07575 [Lachnospiraceae bacterium]|nr:hypothetical protein [Lachnospiraceae bacterium]